MTSASIAAGKKRWVTCRDKLTLKEALINSSYMIRAWKSEKRGFHFSFIFNGLAAIKNGGASLHRVTTE